MENRHALKAYHSFSLIAEAASDAGLLPRLSSVTAVPGRASGLPFLTSPSPPPKPLLPPRHRTGSPLLGEFALGLSRRGGVCAGVPGSEVSGWLPRDGVQLRVP